MCGFSGIISPTIISSDLLQQSLSAIKHRGPDDTLLYAQDGGFYSCSLSNTSTQNRYPSITSDNSSNVLLGFNRLSIVDLSENAMQPFFDAGSGQVFMLNGEIYNYRELREQYLSDATFISESDSEVAFRLYLKLGNEFVHQLRGMFSIVVYDINRKSLKAWRDRLGMKPFYYALVDQTFLFSSEMKGLFATGLVDKSFNYQGLAYSMYLTTCPAPLTIYKNIYALPAAFRLDFDLANQQLITTPYWHLTYNPNKKEIPFTEFSQDVEEICRLHQTGEVRKAIMLSGGTDSGVLAYYLGQSDSSLACLNIYAENHTTDEREYAALNASNAGLEIDFIEIPSNPTAEEFAAFLTAEEEPNCGPEAAVFLCKSAKEKGFKVLYNALGPDEIFGGYPYFNTISQLQKVAALLPFIPTWIVPEKYRSKFRELKEFGVESFPMISRTLFSWDEISQFLVAQGEAIPVHPIQYLKDQIREIYPGFHKLPILKKASYFEIYYYIASHHTFRSDQPSMKYSIEMRFPFLDHLFLQKYFNQANLFNALSAELKPEFKRYARQILPPEIFEMSKRGFSMPTELWENTISLNDKKAAILKSNQQYYSKMLKEL